MIETMLRNIWSPARSPQEPRTAKAANIAWRTFLVLSFGGNLIRIVLVWL